MKPKYLIVHTSVSAWGTVDVIREWHIERGFKDVGYHYIIENGYPTAAARRKKERDPDRNGLLVLGRAENREGAHCPGYNSNSLGICLIGDVTKEPYTDAQLKSLVVTLAIKCRQFNIPIKNILGHCETKSGAAQGKTCPDLDMDDLRKQVETQMKKWTWIDPK